MSELNNPDTRQTLFLDRLNLDGQLVAAELAETFELSIDTIRRDLIALEQRGIVQRVRGGAVPVTKPSLSYLERTRNPYPNLAALVDEAASLLPHNGAVFLDGGTTMNLLASRLPQDFKGLIVTPAPSVALAALSRGVRVHLLGGALCSNGAMATGSAAEKMIETVAADICFLGACGLWPQFGLSAEDIGESGVKRSMAAASAQVVVVAPADRLTQRGPHLVLKLDEIDALVTDAPVVQLKVFADAGVELHHV